jgi:DNA-binding transcriptional ArsR family regulator
LARKSRGPLLATPIRTEIIATIQSLGGEASVADVADRLGRPADGLYYHLRALTRGGLLEERPGADGRRYRFAAAGGNRVALRYRPGVNGNARAVARVAASAARLTQRDFVRALARPDTSVAGATRELWMARLTTWVDAERLAEINVLLNRLLDLLTRTPPKKRSRLIALYWMLTPIDPKPLRRRARKENAP